MRRVIHNTLIDVTAETERYAKRCGRAGGGCPDHGRCGAQCGLRRCRLTSPVTSSIGSSCSACRGLIRVRRALVEPEEARCCCGAAGGRWEMAS